MVSVSDKKEVCVIGAGISGLCAIKHLKDVANVKCYEQKSGLGGLWLYNPETTQNVEKLKDNVYF